jgi:hypothetical protein
MDNQGHQRVSDSDTLQEKSDVSQSKVTGTRGFLVSITAAGPASPAANGIDSSNCDGGDTCDVLLIEVHVQQTRREEASLLSLVVTGSSRDGSSPPATVQTPLTCRARVLSPSEG